MNAQFGLAVFMVISLPAFFCTTANSQKNESTGQYANGLKFMGFNFVYLLGEEFSAEYDFSEKELERMEQLNSELLLALKISNDRPKKFGGSEGRNWRKRSLPDQLFFYKEARKSLSTANKKRLDQIMMWFYMEKYGNRYSTLTNYTLVSAFKLTDSQRQKLTGVVTKAESEFKKLCRKLEASNMQLTISKLNEKQRKAYQQLFDPNRSFADVTESRFVPFSVCMGGDFNLNRELGMTAEQILAIRKISHEYYKMIAEKSEGLSPEKFQNTIALIRHEIYKKETAPRIKALLTLEQLAIVEKHYLRKALAYHGPVEVLFDPAIAEVVGITKKELGQFKKLKDQVRSKNSKQLREFFEKSYKKILNDVDKPTKVQLKKFLGEKPPEFILRSF